MTRRERLTSAAVGVGRSDAGERIWNGGNVFEM